MGLLGPSWSLTRLTRLFSGAWANTKSLSSFEDSSKISGNGYSSKNFFKLFTLNNLKNLSKIITFDFFPMLLLVPLVTPGVTDDCRVWDSSIEASFKREDEVRASSDCSLVFLLLDSLLKECKNLSLACRLFRVSSITLTLQKNHLCSIRRQELHWPFLFERNF